MFFLVRKAIEMWAGEMGRETDGWKKLPMERVFGKGKKGIYWEEERSIGEGKISKKEKRTKNIKSKKSRTWSENDALVRKI